MFGSRNYLVIVLFVICLSILANGERSLLDKLGGKFELVKPTAVVNTLSDDGEVSEWDEEYTLEAYGRTLHLQLKQAKDLFSPDYREVRVDARGQVVSSVGLSEVRTDCYYQGRVADDPDSVVVLSTCDVTPDPVPSSSSAPSSSSSSSSSASRLSRRFAASSVSSRGHGRRAREHKAFHGVIQAHGDKFFLEPAEPHALHLEDVEAGDHIIYSEADYPVAPHTCGNDAHAEQLARASVQVQDIDGVPRMTPDSAAFTPFYPVNGSASSPSSSSGELPPEVDPITASSFRSTSTRFETLANGNTVKYVELVVVNDYLLYQAKGSNTESWSAAVINGVAALYQAGTNLPYSIQVRLVAQYTFAMGDPYARPTAASSGASGAIDSGDLLRKFGAWAGTARAQGRVPAFDNAHLLSGYTFDGSTIGLAYISGMCYTSSTQCLSVGETRALFDPSPSRMATVVAHEMGHNLGMNHDNVVPGAGSQAPLNTLTNTMVQNECNAGDFIMKPAATMTAARWSPCSVAWMQDFFEVGQAASPLKYGSLYNPMCLETAPASVPDTVGATQCGDGIRQGAEQCDCGPQGATADPCCNCATCTLQSGASCSAYDPCCNPSTCSVYTDFRVCRPALSSCDQAETCDGASAQCPADVRSNPGTACSFVDQRGQQGSGLCYAGLCMSHQTQCLQYAQNSNGDRAGQCNQYTGYNDNGGSSACSSQYGLVCAAASGSGCVQFSVSVMDGTPCGSSAQCLNQQCAASSSLPGFDNVRPTVTCPGAQTVFLGSGQSSVQVPAVSASDNVGVATLVYSASGTRLAGRTLSASQGVYTISAVATDASGNQGSCSYTLTVSGNPCSPNPCANGGTCSVSGSSFVCACPPGFSGATCTTNPCATNPCGPGTCAVNTNDPKGYTCTCPSGYSGANCGTSLCSPNPCLNGGTCQLSPGSAQGYTCTCPPGFSGAVCGTTPCSSNPCQNGGTCTVSGSSYVCSCRAGWTGAQCQTSPCASNPCGPGSCSVNSASATGYSCTCPPLYSGANCQVTPCSVNPCMNGGQCQLNSGSSVGYTCSCPAGFSGQYCQTTPCTNNPCVRGTCVVSGSSYLCQCPPGYSGPTCSTSVCDSRPCLNGGQCVVTSSGSYGCSCSGGYFGTSCESGPNPCLVSPNPCAGRTCYYVPTSATKYFCF